MVAPSVAEVIVISLFTIAITGVSTWLYVMVAIAEGSFSLLLSIAIALMVVVVVISNGAVYSVEPAVGSVPSVV